MSNNNLGKIADRAEEALQDQPGFVKAYADTSSDPPTIIYEFSESRYAEEYKFKRETQGTKNEMVVDGNKLVEYRG